MENLTSTLSPYPYVIGHPPYTHPKKPHLSCEWPLELEGLDDTGKVSKLKKKLGLLKVKTLTPLLQKHQIYKTIFLYRIHFRTFWGDHAGLPWKKCVVVSQAPRRQEAGKYGQTQKGKGAG